MQTAVRIPHKSFGDFIEDLVSESNDPAGHYTKMKLIRLANSAIDELNLTVIPNFTTIDGIIPESGNFPMPEDCIRPVIATWVKPCKTGEPICLPLGIRDKQVIPQSGIDCATPPQEPTPADCNSVPFYNYDGAIHEFYVYSQWYYEGYGKGISRFFGWVTYNVENNRIEFSGGPTAGEKVMFTYRSENTSNKIIPKDAIPMIRNMVLHRHWLPTKRLQAQEYWRQFKIAVRQFKKSRLSGYSLDDYVDAFTSEYRSSLRP